MLSILIPIYNHSVYDLVSKLSALSVNEGIEFEIICIDDASQEYFSENEQIVALPGVNYSKLTANIGRSALRNLLASKAQYDYLLFIDTDMKVPNDQYLKNYIDQIGTCDVVYGGLINEENVKSNKYVLRWKYGNKREALAPEIREQDKYFSVKTCNLFIKKDIFDEVKFNENLREYGHEDTLFSVELQRKKFHIKHIKNPLIHLGIERSDIFLNKVELSSKNLAIISKEYLSVEENDQLRLIYFYRRLNKMGVMPILSMLYRVLENRIVRNLLSENPSMLFLDYFKLIAYSKTQNS